MIRTALCLAAWFCLLIPIAATADDCVECHRYETPLAVQDWQLSKHSGEPLLFKGDDFSRTDIVLSADF